MKKLVAFFTIGVLLAGSIAYALTNTEDWNVDAGGWSEGAGTTWSASWQLSGGVGDSGYFQGTRLSGFYATIWPYEPPATTNFTGDLETLYGNNLITISYDAKDFAGTATPGVWHTMYQGGNYWTRRLAETSPTEWTTVSTVFDTTWTDADAAAYGWMSIAGGTWADLMDGVAEQ